MNPLRRIAKAMKTFQLEGVLEEGLQHVLKQWANVLASTNSGYQERTVQAVFGPLLRGLAMAARQEKCRGRVVELWEELRRCLQAPPWSENITHTGADADEAANCASADWDPEDWLAEGFWNPSVGPPLEELAVLQFAVERSRDPMGLRPEESVRQTLLDHLLECRKDLFRSRRRFLGCLGDLYRFFCRQKKDNLVPDAEPIDEALRKLLRRLGLIPFEPERNLEDYGGKEKWDQELEVIEPCTGRGHRKDETMQLGWKWERDKTVWMKAKAEYES
jgi:hypothetical protein